MSETFRTGPEQVGMRLDLFLAACLPGLTRSAIQRLIEQGEVLVDGKGGKASLKLRGGEQVAVSVPPPRASAVVAEEIPLRILYEDGDLVVIDKPAGMVVHPGAGNSSGTLVNALLAHCRDLSGVGGELRPGIVHRIDKDTSGILVVAKHDVSHQALARQFRDHSVKRVYLALVFGAMKTEGGRIEGVIGRNPRERTKMSGAVRRGRHAVTHWRLEERFAEVSLLRLRLETGRTHQIRVHLSEAGHPLLGDGVYGGGGRLPGLKDTRLRSMVKALGRQALHARTLGFLHPVSGTWLEFESPLPQELQSILDYLRKDMEP
jgi:23S rRNA pseudouridine1911/1915/1917 synthase